MITTFVTVSLVVGFFSLIAVGVFWYYTKRRHSRKIKRAINIKYYHQKLIRRLRNKS